MKFILQDLHLALWPSWMFLQNLGWWENSKVEGLAGREEYDNNLKKMWLIVSVQTTELPFWRGTFWYILGLLQPLHPFTFSMYIIHIFLCTKINVNGNKGNVLRIILRLCIFLFSFFGLLNIFCVFFSC